MEFHRQGKMDNAKLIYKKILEKDSNHFDALQLIALIYKQTGQHEVALIFFDKALKINKTNAAVFNNRGNTLREIKRFDDALKSYDDALRIKPDYAEALNNRGITLHEIKRFDDALKSYDDALRNKIDYADAFYNRGNALQELKLLDEALVSYDQAIRIKPDYAEAYSNRGVALKELKLLDEALASYDQAIRIKPDYANAYSNRGVALQELKRLDEALASCDQAIAIKPDYADAYSNRGNALQEFKRLDEALESYDQAIAIKPDYADAFFNRGNALKELNRLDEASASYDQAIRIKPDYADAYSNRGVTLKELKRLDEALASYDQAIAIKPDYADAYWNMSLALLLCGKFDQGWASYEWRWKSKSLTETIGTIRNFTQPLWLGEQSLQDKTILLYSEQGLGDTIQFSRYVHLVVKLGANVILEVQPSLVKLLKDVEGVSQILAKGEPLPEFDYQCPLMSLPLAFKTILATIPSSPRYIQADEQNKNNWQAKLGEKTKSRVGIVWSGSTGHTNDHNRSLTLEKIVSYLPTHIQYICLQKEFREIDKAALVENPHIEFYGSELNDFTDTAALCELMDVIITVDTSVAHLAAALGKPTWILLPFVPDWRWLLDRDDCPWYSTAKLYRQEKINDWAGALEKIKSDLINI
jgi:hypothetical protein